MDSGNAKGSSMSIRRSFVSRRGCALTCPGTGQSHLLCRFASSLHRRKNRAKPHTSPANCQSEAATHTREQIPAVPKNHVKASFQSNRFFVTPTTSDPTNAATNTTSLHAGRMEPKPELKALKRAVTVCPHSTPLPARLLSLDADQNRGDTFDSLRKIDLVPTFDRLQRAAAQPLPITRIEQL